MTANDDTSAGTTPPEPQPARSRRGLFGNARAWVGGHGPQTLVGALLIAVVGGAVSGAFGLLGGGDHGAGPSAGGPASPPTVAPSCFQTTCEGGDPQDAGCHHDARTLADDWESTMNVEVRYSARCHVVWGKLTGARVGDTIEIATTPSEVQRARVNTGRTQYTKMLPVGKEFSAQATGVSVDGSPERDIPAGFTLPVGADQNDIEVTR